MQSKINRFMYSRYGLDSLSKMLVVCALVIDLISALANSIVISVIALVPFIVAVLRILSKNKAKRVKENYRYLSYTQQIRKNARKLKQQIIELRTHKYYKCPSCKTKLRVPRGKGKVKITCPKCRESFVAKS